MIECSRTRIFNEKYNVYDALWYNQKGISEKKIVNKIELIIIMPKFSDKTKYSF